MIPDDITELRCVSADNSGKIRVWDISRCSGNSTDIGILLQSFQYSFSGLQRFLGCLEVMPTRNAQAMNQTLPDLMMGAHELCRFRVQKKQMEWAAPRNVLYNSITNTFFL